MRPVDIADWLIEYDELFQSLPPDFRQEGLGRGQLNIFPPQPASNIERMDPRMITK
jgi:hypothetical protein